MPMDLRAQQAGSHHQHAIKNARLKSAFQSMYYTKKRSNTDSASRL